MRIRRLRPFHTLRARLLWGIGLPLLMLQLAVITLEHQLGRGEELDEMRHELGTLTWLVAGRIDQALALVALATRTKARALTSDLESRRLPRWQLLRTDASEEKLTASSTLVYWGEPGRPGDPPLEVFVFRDGTPAGRADEAVISALRPVWLDRARTTPEGFWSEPYAVPGEADGNRVSYVVPVPEHTSFTYVLSADVPIGRLQAVLRDADFASGGFSIVNRAGTILAADEAEALPAERVAGWIKPLFEPGWVEQGGGVRVMRVAPTDDQARWVFVAPVPSAGWALLATVDQESVLAAVQSRLWRQGLEYGLGAVVILGLLAWLSAKATRPLIPLADAARKAAQGDLEARVAGPLKRDEIGRFAAVFNRMMGDLQASVAGRIEAIAARQAVESELEVALRIQQTLLPAPFPTIQSVEIATRFVPARYVAGDFYDHFRLGTDTLVVAIADVAGKGVAAALFMAAARTSLRNFTRPGVSPAETLQAVNHALREDNRELVFVTAFVGHYHLPSGRLVYANAGHNIPYLIRADGTPEPLGEPTGPLLAVFEQAHFANRQARLAEGETLVLYTDGIVEASDPHDELYGDERFESLLRRNAAEPTETLCDKITDAVRYHCAGAPQDDVTLLVLRRPLAIPEESVGHGTRVPSRPWPGR